MFPLDKPINEESGNLVKEWASGGEKPQEKKPELKPAPPHSPTDASLSEPQRKMVFAKMKAAGLEPENLKIKFGIESTKELKQSQMDEVLSWINDYKKE